MFWDDSRQHEPLRHPLTLPFSSKDQGYVLCTHSHIATFPCAPHIFVSHTHACMRDHNVCTRAYMHTGGANQKTSRKASICSGQRVLQAGPRLKMGLSSASRRGCGAPHPPFVPLVSGDVSARMWTAHATPPGWLDIEWANVSCTSVLFLW